jgi:hypothetical protein
MVGSMAETRAAWTVAQRAVMMAAQKVLKLAALMATLRAVSTAGELAA